MSTVSPPDRVYNVNVVGKQLTGNEATRHGASQQNTLTV
jgi:hypothetical protein